MKHGAPTVAGLALLLAAQVARADPGQADTASGFEPSVHVGAGGFTDELRFRETRPWAPGRRGPATGVHLDLAYRFGPPLDVGLHIAHQWLSVDGLAAESSAVATATAAGLLVRVHPLQMFWPSLPLDVSLGVGFDCIATARQTTTTRVGGIETESRAAVPGVALPLWLGVDVVVGDVAVGVVAIYSAWWRTEACVAAGTGEPECQRAPSAVEHYLFLGASVRLHLSFVGG